MPVRAHPAADPDDAGPARPSPADLGWVFLGGTVGTAFRAGLGQAVLPVASVPVIIMVINVVGAFALGWLLEALGRRGPDVGRRRTVRLAIGTGVLGGFTTYSALAEDTVRLLASAPALAVTYAAVTLVVGGLASSAGIVAGARIGATR